MLKDQKQLLRANKFSSFGEVAVGLVHELKNPLAALKGMTQAVILNPNDQECFADFKDVVPTELDRLCLLVEKLLQLGRAEEFCFKEININDLLVNVLKLFRQRCQAQQIKILNISSEILLVKADAQQLTQVFINLILNAIQAMPKGGTLTISTESQQRRAIIKVADTGLGIPKSKIKNIFQPFFSTKFSGLGLGLAISHNIINVHGGMMQVRSQRGQGTCFEIWLPCH